jgi:uncharacterized OB-fold protein
MTPVLPQPRETPTNAPLLSAWRQEGALLLQRCAACNAVTFYPRSVCPCCWSSQLVWFRAAGTGSIVSFSRIYRGLPEVFQAEVPIILAELALAEGALMIARVVTPDPDAVVSGMQVRLVGPEEAARYSLPTFRST